MADEQQEQQVPIGTTHLMGMLRKGLSEIAQYLPAFNQAGMQTIEDVAIWPNQTQGEIAQARGGPGSGPEQEAPQQKMTLDDLRAYAKERAQEAEQHMERGMERDSGGMEM